MLNIVILNWNNATDTVLCINSLLSSDYQHFKVIIVDNGSDDDSVDSIKNELHLTLSGEWKSKRHSINNHFIKFESSNGNLILLKSEVNYGFAGGVNIGIEYSLDYKVNYILLLNNDTVCDPTSISNLINVLESTADASVIIPKINYYDNRNECWNSGGSITKYYWVKYDDNKNTDCFSRIKKISFATGCVFMIRSAVVKQVGYFSENVFFGTEDIDYCIRLKKKKHNIYCNMESIFYHKVSASQKKFTNLGSFTYHYISLAINMKKHLNYFIWHFWLFLMLTVVFIKNIKNYNKGFCCLLNHVCKIGVYSIKNDSINKEEFFRLCNLDTLGSI